MLRRLPTAVRGVLAYLLIPLGLVVESLPFFGAVLLRLLIPSRRWRRLCSRWIVASAEDWVAWMRRVLGWLQPDGWHVELPAGLRRDGWYLVISNHRSWADILVLCAVFHRRIPMLRYFLKRELIWVPIVGLAAWALDMPFMRRHSRSYLKRHPERRGDDLAAARAACAHFRDLPVAVMNFVEGTRFSPDQPSAADSPYRHLLPPKSGGVALVLGAMGELFDAILDVTIDYGGARPSVWRFVSGQLGPITVRVRELPVPAWLLEGDYLADAEFRARVQGWLRGLWRRKDDELVALRAARRAA